MPRVTKFETALREAFERTAGPDNVTLALALIRGEGDLDAVPAVVALVQQCYNRPSQHHRLMTALNALLYTCGTEYLGHVHMYDGPPVEYLNVGDPYSATLVWYRDINRFRVQGYSDALDWLERRGIDATPS